MDLLASALPPPLIIAIHGAVTNSATWLPLQRELGDTVEFVAPDLPGHGTRRAEPFSIDQAIAIITAQIPQRAGTFPRPVLVIGESLGGYLAILVAAQLQERVSAVIAISASFPMTGFAGGLARATDIPMQLAQMFLRREQLEKQFIAALKRMTDAATADAIAARGLSFTGRSESLTELAELDMRAALNEISVPVYIVNGSFDLPIAWFTRSFAEAAQDGYAVTVPGAWHTCAMTHPAECAEIVRTALIRIARDSAQRTRSFK